MKWHDAVTHVRDCLGLIAKAYVKGIILYQDIFYGASSITLNYYLPLASLWKDLDVAGPYDGQRVQKN